nr:type II toxin-antitoxin system HicB family antitoxin [uncultured Acetatifactor sp.]
MFEQSIDNYLELCQKIGKNPYKEFRGTFNVGLSPEIHRKAALAAKMQKMTLNQYIAKAVQSSFENNETVQKMTV